MSDFFKKGNPQPAPSDEAALIDRLGVRCEFQFSVDAGHTAAESFFHESTDLGLHDHIAISMRSFLLSLAGRDCDKPTQLTEISDAFAAGYLGRIHRELRMMGTQMYVPSAARTTSSPH